MANQGRDEGIHVLDEFVCEAVHAPSVSLASPANQGRNEGMSVVGELLFDAGKGPASGGRDRAEGGTARFVLCVSAGNYPASLEARKVYRAVPDPGAEAKGLVRVIDESGGDSLYPCDLFVAVEIPASAVETLLAGEAA